MNYSISLIIIAYNTANWIDECLNSVFDQTLENIQIIIINNASTDGTGEIIKKRIIGRPNITYIQNKKNLGGAAAGNLGIQHATGEYICLMDSDDILFPDSLALLYDSAVKNNSDIVVGRAKCMYGNFIRNFKFKFYSVPFCHTGTYVSLSKKKELLISPFYWGRIYKRTLIQKHRIRMQKNVIYADMYFNAKAMKYAKNITVTDELCYLWRRFDENASHQSITSLTNNKATFLDRISSYYSVEKLFSGKRQKKIFKFVRQCNIARLLLLVKFTVNDPAFFELFFSKMHRYLKRIPYEDISKFRFLNAKQKLICYCIKNKRKDDFQKVISQGEIFSKQFKGKYSILQSKELFLDVPAEFLRGLRSAIKEFHVQHANRQEEHIILSGCCKIPPKSKVQLSRVILSLSHGEELFVSRPESISQEERLVRFDFKIPVSVCLANAQDQDLVFSLEGLVNGIFAEAYFEAGDHPLLEQMVSN